MARKLLKRKLKITNLKKLKTIENRFHSLADWASKQLSKKFLLSLLTPYPKNLSLKSALHRKQLLSQLVGSFSHLVAAKYNLAESDKLKVCCSNNTPSPQSKSVAAMQNSSLAYPKKELQKSPGDETKVAATLASHKQIAMSTPQGECQSLRQGKALDLSKRGRKAVPGVLMADSEKTFLPSWSKKLEAPQASHWPVYTLNCKSFRKARIGAETWKSIYSLDQLMCHQYESQRQFTRRSSKLKLSLIENRKLAVLYGKLPKKQLTQLMQKANSNRPQHKALVLESRLDVAVKRCFVFLTLRNAHHWINQGRILVNDKIITSPSYILQPGDLLAIEKESRERYKKQFLNYFYKQPKESKFLQSGAFLSRWKEWATPYNYLGSNHNSKALKSCVGGKVVKSKLLGKNALTQKAALPASLSGADALQIEDLSTVDKSSICYPKKDRKWVRESQLAATHTSPWPDRGIQVFWYSSGRESLKCLYKASGGQAQPRVGFFPPRQLGAHNLLHWLKRQAWLKLRLKWLGFRHWKHVYRRRILVFSRWLLGALPLAQDGLYSLRWHRAFIRKKSAWIKASHRHLTLQKALQFEVSYKNLCAIYLYPPQRIVLPFMIDFRKV